MVGPLNPDFLRLETTRDVQISSDRQAAIALYQQQNIAPFLVGFAVCLHLVTVELISVSFQAPNVLGRLSITVAQAKLVRNYGLTRMDPYARVRVGHFVYETQTDPNGGKTPHWNRVIHTQLPTGVSTIFIEIYDECSFKMDELIAWTQIRIPDVVLRGETHEEWFNLSGKQGDNVEGMIDVVMSFTVSFSFLIYSLNFALNSRSAPAARKRDDRLPAIACGNGPERGRTTYAGERDARSDGAAAATAGPGPGATDYRRGRKASARDVPQHRH